MNKKERNLEFGFAFTTHFRLSRVKDGKAKIIGWALTIAALIAAALSKGDIFY